MNETKSKETETEFNRANEAVLLNHRFAVQSQLANQADYNEKMRRAVNKEHGIDVDDQGDDVGNQLNIDSPTEIHNHFGKEEPEKERKTLGTIAKLAIGAGLVATGAGLVPGAAMIIDGIRNSAPEKSKPAPTEKIRYSLDLGE